MSTDRTLLIVDDNPEDREVYRDFLSDDPHISYQFLEAPLAEVGLELFQKWRCDAILLDFHMPDMNGLEFFGELKKLKPGQPLVYPPIIMLTGQGNEAIAVKAMKQGIQDYLVKQHLQPEVLQLAVRNVIQQSHLYSLLSKTREQQRLIATTALRIRQSLDLDQILTTAVSEVQQLLECDHVAVYQCITVPRDIPPVVTHYDAAHPRVAIRAELGIRHTLPILVEGSANIGGNVGAGAATGQALANEALANEDLANEDLANEDLIVPIIIHDRHTQRVKTWGYLVAHQQIKKSPWQPDEQSIIRELAVQLAIAIQQSALLSDAQSALSKSQELVRFKSQIISTISHEYRTPLTAILAAASTLDRHGQGLSVAKQTHFLQMIQTKARHMTDLINDMLVMHQFDLNKSKFEPSPLNLLQFVADLVEEHRELAQDSHELELTVTGRTQGFWGDRGLLRFAISNILSNAVKYSYKGSHIKVSLEGGDTAVTLRIRDHGIGIPPSDRPSLFQAFSRGSNVGTISGTGLGLSIAKACVEMHSGDIFLDSEEAQGTTVTLHLPKEPESLQNIYRS